MTCEEAAAFVAPDANFSNNAIAEVCLIEGIAPGVVTEDYTECGGSITITWTAPTGCDNNSVTLTVDIPVTPAAVPEITIPELPSELTCDEAAAYVAPDASYSNSETGICAIEGVVSGVKSESFTICGGSITITYTIEPGDNCDRDPVVASRAITVLPAPDPVIAEPSLPTTLSCEEATEFVAPDAPFSNNVSSSSCVISGTAQGIVTLDLATCGGSITITWTAPTGCDNNSVSRIATIDIIDETNPEVIMVDPNITIDCGETFEFGSATVSDNCDTDVTLDFEDRGELDPCDGGTIIRVWTATDDCENVDSVQQSVTLTPDNAQPVFTSVLPTDITVSCDNIPAPAQILADDCNSVDVTFDEIDNVVECGRTISRMWTATDACGNSVSHTQIITVDCPVNATVDATGGVNCNNPNAGSAIVSVTSGQAPFTYMWSSGETAETAINLSDGTQSVRVTDSSGCSITLNVNIDGDFTPPTVSTEGGIITCSSPSIVLSVATNGSVSGWTGPNGFSSNQASPEVSAPGTYTVTVEGSNGCMATANATVSEDTQTPSANATGGTITCSVTSVVLSANTNGVISGWTGPNGYSSSEASPTVSAPGTYTVTVEGSNGCTETAVATVLEDTTPPSLTTDGGEITCDQANTVIRVNTSAQVIGWTGPDGFTSNSASPTVTVVGTYTVTVRGSNGCEESATATVTENFIKPSDVVISTEICSGESFTWEANGVAYTTSQSGLRLSNDGCTADQVLNLTVISKPADVVTTEEICSGEIYTWALNGQTYNESGRFVVEADGCTADDVLVLDVTPKPADIVSQITICEGASYTWPVNGITYTTDQSDVRITNDGCSADEVLSLTVEELPNISVAGGTLTCNAPNVTLNASSNASSIRWSGPDNFSSTERSPVVSTPGEYTVIVRNSEGCESSAIATVVDGIQTISIDTDAQSAKCGRSNGRVSIDVLGGSDPYSYLWSNGAITRNITNLPAGTYTVIVTDVNGCSATITETVSSIGEDLTVDFQNVDPASCSLGEVGTAMAVPSGGTAPYTFSWSNGQTTAVIFNLPADTYTVEVTDANGCSALNSIVIEGIEDCIGCIGDLVFEDRNRNGIQDPGDEGIRNVRVKLLDGDGNLLAEQLTDVAGTYHFDNLRPGRYIAQFDTPEDYAVTLPQRGDDEELDSDINMATGQTPIITLDVDDCIASVDAGLYKTASLGDHVWLDYDGDGLKDANERGADNIRIELKDEEGELLASTITNPDGQYGFVNLPPGNYYIVVVAPDGFLYTLPNQGNNDDIDSDVDPNTGISDLIVLNSGEFIDNIDAGLRGFVDVSLTSSVSPNVALPDQIVTIGLTVSNDGNFPATGISVANYLSEAYTDPTNISDDGSLDNFGHIIWSGIDLDPGESVILSFDARVSSEDPSTLDFQNISEVVALDQQDIDSSPANDDGDQSEDDEDSVKISISPCSLTISVTSTPSICDDATGTAEVIATGGVGNLSYLWSNGEETTSISQLEEGTYVVTVTDAEGCSVSSDVEVAKDGADIAISLEVNDESCIGGDGSIKAIATGGQGPYLYSWSNGVETPNNDDIGFGVYVLTVTDANGCAETVEAVVETGQGCLGSDIDLELIKRVNMETPMPGDTISFQLTVFNESENLATGIVLRDEVPNGFEIIPSSISDQGELLDNDIIEWSDLVVEGLSLYRVNFDVVVLPVEEGRSYRNIAQIINADQDDVDSTPGNDDGDQSEDDEDFAMAMPQMSDIAISNTVSNLNPQVGSDITYTVTVNNEGINPLTQVQITDYLPVEFCTNFRNISNSGIFLGDRILWLELNLDPGESIDLTFDATVSSNALGQRVVNRVEVTDMDQSDPDSAPNNMDGEPIEDDEASVAFTVGDGIADLELLKDIDKLRVAPNEEVEFSITIINNGPDPAFGITIEDVLPDGYTDITNLSHGGVLAQNRILWTIGEIAEDEFVTLTFNARIAHSLERDLVYKNIAQITGNRTGDPDSTPNNDDGNQSEDDEDFVEPELVLDGSICADISAAIFLEGAYDYDLEMMHTNLNDLGYLPGQKPSTFFGSYTEEGQPYDQAPWFHFGKEGDQFLQDGEVFGLNAGYPATVTDWVLVSLRSDERVESTVGSTAGLLHDNGEIEFIEGFEICNLDPTEDYYIVIEHRNHLVVMSHIQLPVVNGTITYDFRNRNSYRKIVGSGQKEISLGVYAMIAGNGDQTTRTFDVNDVNPNDLTQWLIDNGLTSSYFLRDYNLSGDVNVSDKGLFLINNGLFSDVPGRRQ